MEVIGTTKLNLIYGDEYIKVHALKDINFSVAKGELTSIIGPSGSGKSSLLHTIGAMLTPTSGEIRIMGEKIEDYSRKQLAEVRREKIGFIFQNYALVNHFSAIDNVMLPLYPVNPPGLRERAEDLLQKVGLEHRMEHTPDHLSGGEKQRVAIARALINEPNIVLGDEITGNLDTKTGDDIFSLVEELNSDGITFLIVTHDPRLAESCRRIVEIRDGKLLG